MGPVAGAAQEDVEQEALHPGRGTGRPTCVGQHYLLPARILPQVLGWSGGKPRAVYYAPAKRGAVRLEWGLGSFCYEKSPPGVIMALR